MIRLIAASIFVLLGATAAQALCVSRPDGAETRYVENNTAQALCLQRELAETTANAAARARIEVMLGNMQIELQRHQQLQHQMIFADPAF